jgi:hypothetical protein
MSITDEQLLDYINGDLSDTQVEQIRQIINLNTEVKDRYETLKISESKLGELLIQSPSSNFVSRVMSSVLEGAEAHEKFFNRSRYFVIALIGLALIGTIYFFTIQFYPTLSGLFVEELTISDKTVDLSPAKQLLDTDLIFKLVFYVNGIVGLLLFERAILKPYFMRRKQRFAM